MAYYPVARLITDITNAQEAVVTFSEDHGYLVGQVLGFRVGTDWGMYQINQLHGQVTSIPSTTQVVVDIDSSTWDSFVTPASTSQANPMAVPTSSGFIQESGIVGANINCAFDKRP
jgi:hypothetical protein